MKLRLLLINLIILSVCQQFGGFHLLNSFQRVKWRLYENNLLSQLSVGVRDFLSSFQSNNKRSQDIITFPNQISFQQAIRSKTQELDVSIASYRYILSLLLNESSPAILNKQTVIHALKEIEKTLDQKYRLENRLIQEYLKSSNDSISTSFISNYQSSTERMFQELEGSWRLRFTVSANDLQPKKSNKSSRINYFPLKAIQSFSFNSSIPLRSSKQKEQLLYNRITNTIYLQKTPLLQFQGAFRIIPSMRKVSFDFARVVFFDRWGVDLPSFASKAFYLPSSSHNDTSLITEAEMLLILRNKPFFKWILSDEEMAIARGRGGGLAIWKRVFTNQ